MSYTITVAARPAANLLGAMPEDARCLDVGGGRFQIYRPGRSTRGVAFSVEDGRAEARMVSFANEDDWLLGLELLRAFAADGSTIEGEDGTTAKGDPQPFLTAMIRENAAAFVVVKSLVAERGEKHPKIVGPKREVLIGERLLRDVADDPIALMERIRRLQYLEDEGFEVVEPMSLPAGIGVEISLWDPRKAQAFAPTKHVGLSAPSGSLTIPVAEVPALAGSHFHWLDEEQFAIDAAPEDELPELFRRAALVAASPHEKVTRKWWQFWK
jgi:hypothetical protein